MITIVIIVALKRHGKLSFPVTIQKQPISGRNDDKSKCMTVFIKQPNFINNIKINLIWHNYCNYSTGIDNRIYGTNDVEIDYSDQHYELPSASTSVTASLDPSAQNKSGATPYAQRNLLVASHYEGMVGYCITCSIVWICTCYGHIRELYSIVLLVW